LGSFISFNVIIVDKILVIIYSKIDKRPELENNMSTKVKAKHKTNSDKSTLKIKDLKTW